MAGVTDEQQISHDEDKMADLESKPEIVKEKSDDESSDEEPAPGLFDKPLMLFGEKRERKKVERLSIESIPTPKKEGLDFSKGRGVKLGDLEITRYELDKSLSSELKPLHRLLYGKEGKVTFVKKNIRAFCGFPFDTNCKEYANLQWGLEKFANTGLKRMCEIFGLEVKGKRDELKEKILKFLMEPYKSNKKVPAKAVPKGKKKVESKAKPTKSNETMDDASDDEDEADDEQEEEQEEKSKKNEEKTKPKNKPKKSTVIKLPAPKKRKQPVEEKPKKATTPKKASKKSDADSDDDEPLAKIVKTESPSDEVLEKTVKELLEGADLETVTMKIICKQVFDKFPGCDISDRKSFIKETVKKQIS